LETHVIILLGDDCTYIKYYVLQVSGTDDLIKNHHVEKRSAAEYYLCISTTLSACDDSCSSQCTTKHTLEKTFPKDGKCYEVLADGACASENTCLQGFKCNCKINEIDCV